MTLDEELTLGELRTVLARGSSEMTIRQALSAIAEQDEVDHRHALAQERYTTYMATRRELRARAEREAMDELDIERQQTGQPWPTKRPAPERGGRQDSRLKSASTSTSRYSSSRTG